MENEQILMQGVFARFKEQNARLRMHLKELESSVVVNLAVFKALDNFDSDLNALSANPHYDEQIREAVTKMFVDFTVMRECSIRENNPF